MGRCSRLCQIWCRRFECHICCFGSIDQLRVMSIKTAIKIGFGWSWSFAKLHIVSAWQFCILEASIFLRVGIFASICSCWGKFWEHKNKIISRLMIFPNLNYRTFWLFSVFIVHFPPPAFNLPTLFNQNIFMSIIFFQ